MEPTHAVRLVVQQRCRSRRHAWRLPGCGRCRRCGATRNGANCWRCSSAHRPRQPRQRRASSTVGVRRPCWHSNEAGRAAYATRLRKPLQLMQSTARHACTRRSVHHPDGSPRWFPRLFFRTESRRPGAGVGCGIGIRRQRVDRDLPSRFSSVAATPDGWPARRADRRADSVSRARAFLFPQQFASIEEPFVHSREALFRTAPLETNLLPRGVYFTSALQGGPGIDRAPPATRQQMGIADSPPAAAEPPGQHSYFLSNGCARPYSPTRDSRVQAAALNGGVSSCTR